MIPTTLFYKPCLLKNDFVCMANENHFSKMQDIAAAFLNEVVG